MPDWIDIQKDSNHISREKLKAARLKRSGWWKNKTAEGRCYYCDERFMPAELTMDHIVPLSRGGKSTKGNVAPCCKSCNNKKRYLTPAEMILNNHFRDKKSSPFSE